MLGFAIFVTAASITLNNTGIQEHSLKTEMRCTPHGDRPHVQKCLKAKIKSISISEQYPGYPS